MSKRKLPEEMPIGVHEKITPITKQPVLEVQANRWHEMSVVELYDQKSILDHRCAIAAQLGNTALLEQIRVGISRIECILRQKAEDNEDSGLI